MAWVEQTGANSWRVRYFKNDGSIGSVSGFRTKKTASDHANSLEAEQSKGTWLDPAGGRTTVAGWTDQWLDTLDVDLRTEENYRSMLRVRILPHWQSVRLAEITGAKVHAWAKTLRQKGLADISVTDTVKLFSLILGDAVDEKLIATNPIRPRRRGRGRRARTREKVWATPAQVIQIADQATAYYGLDGGILILTAGWTGARWGELVGLQRFNLHLDDGYFVVDPDIGSLHESASGKMWLGPPKTPESARTVTLPEFLIPLLRAYLETHDHPHVFVTPTGGLHRRSNFSRRCMRPAADGNQHVAAPDVRTRPVKPGLLFHGLRHGHKTWMIGDAVPEVAQSRRLGHKLPDKIQEVYSHVEDAVEKRLLAALQKRWTDTISTLPVAAFDASWRDAA